MTPATLEELGLPEAIAQALTLLGAYGLMTRPLCRVRRADGTVEQIGFDIDAEEDPGGFIYGALRAMGQSGQITAALVVSEGWIPERGGALVAVVEEAGAGAFRAMAPFSIKGPPPLEREIEEGYDGPRRDPREVEAELAEVKLAPLTSEKIPPRIFDAP